MNPFIVGKSVPDEYFCDRSEETEFLIKQINNGRNVALISPRRIGKTGLILHTLNQQEISQSYYTFFVDIYATSSLREFVYVLSKAIYAELKPKKTVWAERLFQAVQSIRVGFKLNTMTGEPTLDIGLGDIQTPQTTLDEIFDYLETADKPCVVVIDEFQQIAQYAEKNMEALLRTKIQQCNQTTFIFSGSKRHVMTEMFNSSAKPFYQSAISMGLNPLKEDVYIDFASELFRKFGKNIDTALIEKVYRQFCGCTWFVQMMMNELFALTPASEKCNVDKYQTAWDNVIMAQEESYKVLLSHLAPQQKAILQAIAKEGEANRITSSAFIKKYNLQSASSVQAAVKALLRHDLIMQENDAFRVYDYFFAEWMKKFF